MTILGTAISSQAGEIMSRLVTGEVAPNVFTVSKIPNLSVMKYASLDSPGTIWVSGYSVIHVNGREVYRYILDSAMSPDGSGPGIIESSQVVSNITGSGPYWSYGAMSRDLMKWFGHAQKDRAIGLNAAARIPVRDWHYQKVIPGKIEHATMYDLRAAYWQIAARMKSPLFDVLNDGSIIWRKLSRIQSARWDRLRADLMPYKRLRLTLIGINSSGWNNGEKVSRQRNSVAYSHGRAIEYSCPLGELLAASKLAVRCVFEYTQDETRKIDSQYSNGDCVVTASKQEPELWNSAGLDWTIKAQGPADIQSSIGYKIGERTTRGYLNAEKFMRNSGACYLTFPAFERTGIDDSERWYKKL